MELWDNVSNHFEEIYPRVYHVDKKYQGLKNTQPASQQVRNYAINYAAVAGGFTVNDFVVELG